MKTELQTELQADGQQMKVEGNGMELKTLNLEAISIPTFHPRVDYGSFEGLQSSMRREGLQEPLLVYEIEAGRFGVIDGARRLKAALEMGWKEISCLVKANLTDAEAAHLAFVKNHERKTLSLIEEALHMRRMKEEYGFTYQDMEIKGYGSRARISQMLKLLGLAKWVQDRIAEGELSKDHGLALSRLPTGHEQVSMANHAMNFLWSAVKTEERVKKYLAKNEGSKREIATALSFDGEVPGVYFKDSKDMKELPSDSVQLIVTSPPYLIGQEYEVSTNFAEHIENVSTVMAECARVLVPGGVLALNLGDIHNARVQEGRDVMTRRILMGHRYQSWLKKGKVHLDDVVIWRKRLALGRKDFGPIYSDATEHTKYRVAINWEYIYIYRKDGARSTPADDIAMRSRLTREQFNKWVDAVWEIDPVHAMKGHPAIWPEEIPTRLIRMFSYEGDNVLDPFLGSGTTLKVAQQLGRIGIGYERALQYKPVIVERLGVKAMPEQGTIADYVAQALQEGSEQGEGLMPAERVAAEVLSKFDGDGYSGSIFDLAEAEAQTKATIQVVEVAAEV